MSRGIFVGGLGLEVSPDGRAGSVRFDPTELARHEEIRLVQRVFLTPGVEARRVVLFAGVEQDNGCGEVCIRAGQTLARLKPQSVCIVDANLRTPVLDRVVGTDNRDGFAAAVAHSGLASTFSGSQTTRIYRVASGTPRAEDCTRRLRRPPSGSVRRVDWRATPDNLWLLPAGSSPSDPDLLLTTDRLRPRMQELVALFDHVLVYAPPIDLYAESLTLSQFVDGVVLVLEAHATRREIARNMKARLEDLGVPLLGVVLNHRTFPIPDAVYRLL